MQYFFITCIWIVYTPYLTSASSSDLFSPGPGNDETDLLAMNDPIDLSFIENSDALSSSLDDNNLFTTDKIFSPTNVVDANGSDFLDQSSADLILNNDPFLLTDTSSPDSCHSSLSKTRKIRMRSSNICSASEQQQNGGQSSFPSSSQELNSITSMAVAKAVDASIRRKWCSSSGVQGFGNIPVCNVGEFGGEMENSEEKAVEAAGLDVDDASVAASPFRNLLSCHLLTPLNHFECYGKDIYCCNAFLPEYEPVDVFPLFSLPTVLSNLGVGFWCVRGMRKQFSD